MVTEIKFPDDIIDESKDELYSEEINDEIIDQMVDCALMILDVWNPSARGKAPTGVAATTVYVAAMEYDLQGTEITQHQLCDIFNTSPVTIRNQTSECVQKARSEGVIE